MADRNSPFTFVAGVAGDENYIDLQRILLDADLQADLTSIFEGQAAEFIGGESEPVEFDPGATYRLEKEQIFRIKDFHLPQHFIDAARRPHSLPDFSLKNKSAGQIKTIAAIDAGPNDKSPARFLFQQFRTTQLLDRSRSLFATEGTFRRIKNDGMTIAHELVAVHHAGNLYFRSLSIVSRFLDLAAYETEANDEQITEFVASEKFVPDDIEGLEAMIKGDGWLKRRIASILSNNILAQIKPGPALKRKAKVFDVEFVLEKEGKETKIRLPKDKKNLKNVIKFMNEEYFHGEITHATYETNSLRRLGAG
jgi:hypothetical protein